MPEKHPRRDPYYIDRRKSTPAGARNMETSARPLRGRFGLITSARIPTPTSEVLADEQVKTPCGIIETPSRATFLAQVALADAQRYGMCEGISSHPSTTHPSRCSPTQPRSRGNPRNMCGDLLSTQTCSVRRHPPPHGGRSGTTDARQTRRYGAAVNRAWRQQGGGNAEGYERADWPHPARSPGGAFIIIGCASSSCPTPQSSRRFGRFLRGNLVARRV